jgi:hypothetical protein
MKTIKDIILTPESELPAEFVMLCKRVTAKRPRAVIEHILKHGIISNEELSELYGYDHPPRAIRDVRENGVPLLTHMIASPKTGRRMGAYTFDDVANVKGGRIGGRRAFSKQFKLLLLEQYGSREAITGERLEERYLQIDHRIPYEVVGDEDELVPEKFMLLDASSQRAKSWSCEHCDNFRKIHDPTICQRCFWAFPEDYDHIAMEQKRRVDIVWSGKDVSEYDAAKVAAQKAGQLLPDFIKGVLCKK